jgi:hypothetical protein
MNPEEFRLDKKPRGFHLDMLGLTPRLKNCGNTIRFSSKRLAGKSRGALLHKLALWGISNSAKRLVTGVSPIL